MFCAPQKTGSERRDDEVTGGRRNRGNFGLRRRSGDLCGGTVMFPDAQGKMVRIPIAHSYEQCRKNGRHLGYPDGDSHAWCTEHCKGNICQ